MKRIWMVILGLCCACQVMADASVPKADIAGAKDSALVGRFAGSFIVSYDLRDYDELKLPLAPLKQVADQARRDTHNNMVFEPGQSKALEGRRTRLVYVLPDNVAPLQALRNYQNDIAAKGGKTLFECKSPDCGGDPARSSDGGGGDQSLAMYLWPQDNIKDKAFTNGNCAQTARTGEQRYGAMELPKSNAINTAGRVALYGLYFDSGRADVKPESKDTLVQIAKLLTTTPTLKLLVVGHTDNVGEFANNQDLSRRRADAVIALLAAQYKVDRKRLTPVGVSFASPIAANTSEDGKAKNRRVELVPNH